MIRTARELKKVGGILAKPVPKKGKTLFTQETLDLVQSFFEDDEYSRQIPGKKDYVSISWNVHKQKQLVLCNSVGSIRTVQCIQRQISQYKNQIFQVSQSKTKMV